MLSSKIQLDDIDKKIVTLIQKDPSVTHTKIARIVNRSQPTVGLRIKKLEKIGIIQYQAGFDLKNVNLIFAKVDIQTNNPDFIINIIRKCPYMIHAYRVSGKNNLSVIIASSNLQDLDKIINYHFREEKFIQNITMELITKVINEFVLPLDIFFKKCDCLN
ncbi:MAG: Lrp/AsnC family transcriptional regulator [Promethearchaeota archaeon]|nr:MAG: Lrp/AsnC family transcriptional regulator [Candidatus Lokiarchaeota archaeon]